MKKQFLFFALLTVICLSGCGYYQDSNNKETSTTGMNYTLNKTSSVYEGTYAGNLLNSKPNGNGTFTYSEFQDSDVITVTGTWKNGNLNGIVKTLNPDMSYSISMYDNGKPYGIISYYNKNNKYIDCDWYYNYKTIKEYKSISKYINYNKLYMYTSNYEGSIIKVEGTVVEIINNKTDTILIIKEKSTNKIYMCSYSCIETSKFSQGIVPNLKAGDYINAIGSFEGFNLLKDATSTDLDITTYSRENTTDTSKYYKSLKNYYNKEHPFVYLIYGENNIKTKFDLSQESTKYNDFIKYPYHYMNKDTAFSATILEITVDYYNNKCYFLLQNNNNTKCYAYVDIYDYNIPLPKVGTTMTVTGKIMGNTKLLKLNSKGDNIYNTYPLLYIDFIEQKGLVSSNKSL